MNAMNKELIEDTRDELLISYYGKLASAEPDSEEAKQIMSLIVELEKARFDEVKSKVAMAEVRDKCNTDKRARILEYVKTGANLAGTIGSIAVTLTLGAWILEHEKEGAVTSKVYQLLTKTVKTK